jgi:predicted GIY-YIG superfamily endonuclease
MKKTLETARMEASKIGVKLIGDYAGVMHKTIYLCEIHGEFLQIPNKVQQGIGCQKCGRESQHEKHRKDISCIKNDAEKVNLAYISGYKSVNSPANYLCHVHGKISMRPSSIIRGSGCNQCGSIRAGLKKRKPKKVPTRPARTSLEALLAYAEDVGLTYADVQKGLNSQAKYICATHGEIIMRPNSTKRGAGCKFCAGNVQKTWATLSEEARKVNLEFLGPIVNDRTLTNYHCMVHGDIQKRAGSVASGSGCKYCAKYGPDASSPATFYVYNIDFIDGRSFIGYGMTKDMATRNAAHTNVASKNGAVISMIGQFDMRSGRDALDLEFHLQKTFKDYHVDTGMRGFREEAVSSSISSQFMQEVNNWMTVNV